jgi:hypothetical protein
MQLGARLAVLLLLGALSCNGNDPPPPTCTAEPPDLGCTPLYEPTFDEIFARTLSVSCGRGGAACHSAEGRQGGLTLVEADESHRLLLERGRVRPGDAACSEVVVRLKATDPFVRMPPGRALDEAEQCAIVQWIATGAPR